MTSALNINQAVINALGRYGVTRGKLFAEENLQKIRGQNALKREAEARKNNSAAPVAVPSAASALPTSGGGTGALTRSVEAQTETVQGQLGGLLKQDKSGGYTNPIFQQAAEASKGQFAGRGLLNSSMAVQAGNQAAMSKALEVAVPDAQTYFSQSRANQDAGNVFNRDRMNNAAEMSRLQESLATQRAISSEDNATRRSIASTDAEIRRQQLAQQGSQYDSDLKLRSEQLAQQGSQYDSDLKLRSEQLAQQGSQYESDLKLRLDQLAQQGSQFDRDMSYRQSTAQTDADLRREQLAQQALQSSNDLKFKYDQFQLDADSRIRVEEASQKYALQRQKDQEFGSQYELYVRRLAEVDNNPNLDADSKIQLKNSAGKDLQLYASARQISVEMDLANRFAKAAVDAQVASESASSAQQRWATDYGGA